MSAALNLHNRRLERRDARRTKALAAAAKRAAASVRRCVYSNEPVFPADRGALRAICPRCSRELAVVRRPGDRCLPRYPSHKAAA